MKIGSFEDRIGVETHRQINKVWVNMLEQFSIESGSKDEKRFVEGFRRGLIRSLHDVVEWLEWEEYLYEPLIEYIPTKYLEQTVMERKENESK